MPYRSFSVVFDYPGVVFELRDDLRRHIIPCETEASIFKEMDTKLPVLLRSELNVGEDIYLHRPKLNTG